MELAALIFRMAAETSSINPIAGEGWPSANRDVERTLAAQGCMCLSMLRAMFVCKLMQLVQITAMSRRDATPWRTRRMRTSRLSSAPLAAQMY